MKFLVLFFNILLFLIGYCIFEIIASYNLFDEPSIQKTEKEIIEQSLKEIQNPSSTSTNNRLNRGKEKLLFLLLFAISSVATLNFTYIERQYEFPLKKKLIISFILSTLCVVLYFGLILVAYHKIESGLLFITLYLAIGLFFVPVIVKELVGIDMNE